MTTTLETYDPDWEKHYDHHRAAQQAILDQVRNQRDQGKMPMAETERMLQLLEQEQAHALGWQKAEQSSFRTIHDYAEHRFGYLAAEAADAGVPFTMPAFDDDDTLEDGMIEYRRISQEIDAATGDSGKYRPAGRPNGLDIFEPGEDRHIGAILRAFEGGRFHPTRVVALIAFDLRPTETHICLSCIPDHADGTHVAKNHERIIEVLYQEALDAEQTGPLPWSAWFADRLERSSTEGFDAFCYPRSALTPANMHFYSYAPPETSLGVELFERLQVNLYRHPPVINDSEWLDHVPAYIKTLRYNKVFRRAEPPVVLAA